MPAPRPHPPLNPASVCRGVLRSAVIAMTARTGRSFIFSQMTNREMKMADTTINLGQSEPRAHGPLSRLWSRELNHYPDTGPRVLYLAIVVVATVIVYYENYIAGAVSPTIIAHYGMSFHYFVNISVVAAIFGAFASLIAGLADRWGRANLVAWGLGITGVLTLFGIPNAPNKLTYLVLFSITCLLYTSPSPRDRQKSRMPSSA